MSVVLRWVVEGSPGAGIKWKSVAVWTALSGRGSAGGAHYVDEDHWMGCIKWKRVSRDALSLDVGCAGGLDGGGALVVAVSGAGPVCVVGV